MPMRIPKSMYIGMLCVYSLADYRELSNLVENTSSRNSMLQPRWAPYRKYNEKSYIFPGHFCGVHTGRLLQEWRTTEMPPLDNVLRTLEILSSLHTT